MNSRIYLDYNATTPIHPEILPYIQDNLKFFGNPSSVHWAGRETKKILTATRRAVSESLHCDPLEVVFTSSGSEGNNLALKGALADFQNARREIVCSEVEHPSVLKTIEHLRAKGYVIRFLKVSRGGEISLEDYANLLSEKTALVTCQLVNNETGNIFPIKKMARLAHQHGALFHSDMVQSLGKIPVDLSALDVDYATFAGHKFYSLKGSAFLFVKKGSHLSSLVHGGGQERGRRAGTENTLALGSLGEAFRLLMPRLEETTARISTWRDKLEADILAKIPGARVNGAQGKRVGNTLNVSFDRTDGETLLINLDTRGFAVSSGAACSSGSQEPSPVLTHMGLTQEEASQSLRISLGWLTTEEQIELFLKNLILSVDQIRRIHDENIERELA
ncbi:unnamed protein product [Sphagnum balticum]